jgi:serine/threonine protein kinase
MKSLRHPNIVKLVGVCWSDDMFACCLEFVENGSLEDWLRKASGKHHGDLTWKDKLLKSATECAIGVQYLHQSRYWSDGSSGGDADSSATEKEEKEEAGWHECIIHRDLKPDNMLLTNDWTLKLTDFGEARSVNLNQTMTSVGTPIYVAPEVMKGNRYDATADSYSFGVCLVAMIRAERQIMEFYFQALRKHMKRPTKAGVGVAILNHRMYTKKWRPLLPMNFLMAYPKLSKLVTDCWSHEPEKRPIFDEIVRRLNGEIADEVRRKEEPLITFLSKEPDALYQEQLAMEAAGELFATDDDGDEEMAMDTSKFVARLEYERVLAELKARGEQREVLVEKLAENENLLSANQKLLAEKEKEVEALRKSGGEQPVDRHLQDDAAASEEMAAMLAMMGRAA